MSITKMCPKGSSGLEATRIQIQTGSPSSISAAESCAWSSFLQQRKAADRIFATSIPMLAGVGCSGSYGAGMARELAGRGIPATRSSHPGHKRICSKGDAADALRAALQALYVVHESFVRSYISFAGLGTASIMYRYASSEVSVDCSDVAIAKGDNPKRMRSKAAFTVLCGASPLKASRGASATGSTAEGTGARTGYCT